ncbi:MAG: DnaD domain protein [Dehalococcoidales bacterium]|jgi:DnaD/phage-associated family protein|nr:DnaD domain protein [Dehalococcoidales bacterium]NLT27780.1 DnaD domain protein [Dehalococcoidales bacterium]
MTDFNGFPSKMSYTAVPNIFINNVLPQIDDIGELKVILHIIEALYNKKGYPRYVSFSELAANASLMSNFKQTEKPLNELEDALKLAMEHKIILGLSTENGDIYFVNTEADRQAASKIKSGEHKVTGIKYAIDNTVSEEEPINIFSLYEENIGILTPMIAEGLKDAIKLYPETWIADAIKEAVKQNVRKLSYITAVLENWAKEGRNDGTYWRYSKKDDPEKYTGGEFGRFVQH